MNKYGVLIHGFGYDLLDESGNKINGFYVSIFLEAGSINEACQNAIELFVESEAYASAFDPDQHPNGMLQVEAADELYSFDEVPYPMSGLVFYKDDDQDKSDECTPLQ